MKKRLLWICLAAAAAAWTTTLSAVDFKIAPYLRLRHEYWKNLYDMNNDTQDDRNFYRFKLSLAGQADFCKDFGAYVKLTNESRAYIFNAGGDTTYNINEAVFDNLYVDVKNIASQLNLRLGRQDFLPALYGEGFLFGDGTPQDGSRTFYFNAAKASWQINASNTLDGIFIDDNKYDSLPVINEGKTRQLLNSTEERAFALYHKSDLSPALHLEDYYIWKHENAGGPLLQAQETNLNTAGAFARYIVQKWLTVRGQLAYQFGTYGSEDRRGVGGYLCTDASFAAALWKPQFTLGYYYLSGDDPKTKANEAWDPLFSRYPWLSEIYALSFARESGNGYWTNFTLARLGMTVSPFAKTNLSLTYNIVGANYPAAGALFGTGTDRGTLYQGKLSYLFSPHVSAYFLLEYFTPGDFYAGSDPAVFTRTELQVKF